MEELNNLSKKERKFLKRQEREQQKAKNRQKRKIKKFLGLGSAALIVSGIIWGAGWWIFQQEPIPESEIISQNGLHWHPELSIKILGQKMEIPANIGLGITEGPIHTHEADGIIHLEFSGLVRKDDLKFGRFFEIWGKTFDKNCVFDKCNGPEGQVKMFVNSKENFEFENYIMQDEDKIEIIFK